MSTSEARAWLRPTGQLPGAGGGAAAGAAGEARPLSRGASRSCPSPTTLRRTPCRPRKRTVCGHRGVGHCGGGCSCGLLFAGARGSRETGEARKWGIGMPPRAGGCLKMSRFGNGSAGDAERDVAPSPKATPCPALGV